MELALSAGFVAAVVLLGAVHGLLLLLGVAASHARVEKEGSSALLGRGLMNALYGVVVGFGRVARALGFTANGVTWASLVLGVAAGALLAVGRFGSGALVATVAAGADAVDGWLAREAGTASDAGEVFDTTVDRYVELAFFVGLAVFYRESPFFVVLVFAALGGAFMVSYATAKAEAARITVPRGTMRRTERLVYLVAGVVLEPLVAAWDPRWAAAPVVVVLGLIAVLGNASAVLRLHALARGLRARDLAAKGVASAPGTPESALDAPGDGAVRSP